MKKFERALFELLRLGIHKEATSEFDFSRLNEKQWNNINYLSKKYGIYALVFDGICSLPEESFNLPPNLASDWATLSAGVERRTLNHWNVLDRLVRLFDSNGIKVMLLKGMGLTLLYPKANHRDGGDFDIYLMGDYEKGNRIIEKLGLKVDTEKEKHSHFTFEKIEVENHVHFLDLDGFKDFRKAEYKLQQLMEQEKPTELSLANTRIFLPSVNFNALFLLCHTAMHLLGGDTMLRQFTDITLFFEKNAAVIDHQLLLNFLKQTRLFVLAQIILTFCVDNLGLSIDRIPSEYYFEDKEVKEQIKNFMLYYPLERKGLPSNASFAKKMVHKTRCMLKRRKIFNLIYGGGYLRFYLPQTIYSHIAHPHTITD